MGVFSVGSVASVGALIFETFFRRCATSSSVASVGQRLGWGRRSFPTLFRRYPTLTPQLSVGREPLILHGFSLLATLRRCRRCFSAIYWAAGRFGRHPLGGISWIIWTVCAGTFSPPAMTILI